MIKEQRESWSENPHSQSQLGLWPPGPDGHGQPLPFPPCIVPIRSVSMADVSLLPSLIIPFF